jgi:Redoxin
LIWQKFRAERSFIVIRARAGRTKIPRKGGMKFQAPEAVRLSRAPFAITTRSYGRLGRKSLDSARNTKYQKEAVKRLHLPFPLLSDERLLFTEALKLPTFRVESMTLIRRLTLVIGDGLVERVFYPVFPPDKNADEVIGWLRNHLTIS